MRSAACAVTTAVALVLFAGMTTTVAHQPDTQPSTPVVPSATDAGPWRDVLSNYSKLRRTVRHAETSVEAITESDDAALAAKLKELAAKIAAQQKRGEQVNVWDAGFAPEPDLRTRITLEVSATARGIRVAESSDDAGALAAARAHSMALNEMIRSGPSAPPALGALFKLGDPLPQGEIAVGGVPHRVLLAQPDAGQLAALKAHGVDGVVNFRNPSEHGQYDEKSAAAGAGLAYCNLPYGGAAELTDELVDTARAELRSADKRGDAVVLHCRTGNRAGVAWAAYRVLDRGVPLEQAIAEARAGQMVDPLIESRTRDYIRRSSPGGTAEWVTLESAAMTPAQQAQQTKAIAARDAMYSQVLSALMTALTAPGEQGGPVGAISVCKEQAPKIAQTVAREKGVMIGRTSFKLRNPGNAAPAWARTLIDEKLETPRFVAHPDGSFGATLPIRVTSTCLTCHGDPQPAVKAALAEKYPKDQATGFRNGDLRGWFWVEIPPG